MLRRSSNALFGTFLAHNTMEPMNFFAHVTEDQAELIGVYPDTRVYMKECGKTLGPSA